MDKFNKCEYMLQLHEHKLIASSARLTNNRVYLNDKIYDILFRIEDDYDMGALLKHTEYSEINQPIPFKRSGK